MESKKLSELTDEELLKRKKTTKFVVGMFLGVLAVLIVFNIINIINGDQHWGVLAVPLGLLPILILNYNAIKQIKIELKSRGLE